jgi:hypothetical protein
MIGCGLPGILQQFDSSQFLQGDTAPVIGRADWAQAALALPTILIAAHSQLFSPIPAQTVRTEQSRALFVDGADGLLAGNRGPNQAIDVFHSLNLRLNDAHRLSRYRDRSYPIKDKAIYNTVVLGWYSNWR